MPWMKLPFVSGTEVGVRPPGSGVGTGTPRLSCLAARGLNYVIDRRLGVFSGSGLSPPCSLTRDRLPINRVLGRQINHPGAGP